MIFHFELRCHYDSHSKKGTDILRFSVIQCIEYVLKNLHVRVCVDIISNLEEKKMIPILLLVILMRNHSRFEF